MKYLRRIATERRDIFLQKREGLSLVEQAHVEVLWGNACAGKLVLINIYTISECKDDAHESKGIHAVIR